MLMLLPLLLPACLWISDEEHKGRVADSGIFTPGDSDADTDTETDADTDTDVPADADGDGYTSEQDGGTDCDDSDADVHPDATETCETEYDDDCDGVSDEQDAVACTVWYMDSDGDGFGDAAVGRCGCEANGGYSAVVSTDCDDGDSAVNPSRLETCATTVDDDCDGDTNDEGAEGCVDWHPDGDGDEFGDEDSARCGCDATAEFTTVDGTDCDDVDAGVSPSGTETCTTSADDDCDGVTNEQDVPGCEVWYADADSDGFGDSAVGRCGCDAYGTYDTLDSSDCDDTNAAVNPDAVEVCENGLDDDCDGGPGTCGLAGDLDLGAADAKLIGDATSGFAGIGVAGAGDVDADGYDDVLIGAGGESFAFLEYGPIASRVDLGSADARIPGAHGNGYTGYSVSGAGDVDDDGYDDVVIGAPLENGYASEAGSAYVVLGPVSGLVDVTTAGAMLYGMSSADQAGTSVSGGGDIDADGHDDIVVGAPFRDDGGSSSGVAYIVVGPVTGIVGLSSSEATLVGENADDWAGQKVAVVDDVDGDGLDDVLIGAMYEDSGGASAGAAYLVLGPAAGTIDLSAADAKLIGEAAGDLAGSAVAGAGDTDGDGLGDLVIGARNESTAYSGGGAAYLVLGAPAGTVALSTATAKLTGEGDSDYAGGSVGGAGDVNSDGFSDVLVGAWHADSSQGRAYLAYGPLSGTMGLASVDVSFIGENAGDEAGVSVAGAGDVDGDTYDDVLVGADEEGSGGSAAGAVYLWLGSGW